MPRFLDYPSASLVPAFADKQPCLFHRPYGAPDTDCGKAQSLGDGRNINFWVFSKGSKNLSGVFAEVVSICTHQNIKLAFFTFTSLLFIVTYPIYIVTYGLFHRHFGVFIVTYDRFLPQFRPYYPHFRWLYPHF